MTDWRTEGLTDWRRWKWIYCSKVDLLTVVTSTCLLAYWSICFTSRASLQYLYKVPPPGELAWASLSAPGPTLFTETPTFPTSQASFLPLFSYLFSLFSVLSSQFSVLSSPAFSLPPLPIWGEWYYRTSTHDALLSQVISRSWLSFSDMYYCSRDAEWEPLSKITKSTRAWYHTERASIGQLELKLVDEVQTYRVMFDEARDLFASSSWPGDPGDPGDPASPASLGKSSILPSLHHFQFLFLLGVSSSIPHISYT